MTTQELFDMTAGQLVARIQASAGMTILIGKFILDALLKTWTIICTNNLSLATIYLVSFIMAKFDKPLQETLGFMQVRRDQQTSTDCKS